jgi:hypothetical protein
LTTAAYDQISRDGSGSDRTFSLNNYPVLANPDRDEGGSDAGSDATVCDFHNNKIVSQIVSQATPQSLPFTTFLTNNNVGLVVRVNSLNKRGMCSSSYDEVKMGEYGFEHKDMKMIEGGDGIPRRQDVAESLGFCIENTFTEDTSGRGAVLVHCEEGVGRSVVIACCLAIEHFDVPGRALLGWCHIARPGAINTAKQERFLFSLRGRNDLRTFCSDSQPPACCVMS